MNNLFEDLFSSVETQMRGKLAEIRAKYSHRGNKGTVAEQAIRGFLKEYLPKSFSVGQGEVIDTKGSRSGQVDLSWPLMSIPSRSLRTHQASFLSKEWRPLARSKCSSHLQTSNEL